MLLVPQIGINTVVETKNSLSIKYYLLPYKPALLKINGSQN